MNKIKLKKTLYVGLGGTGVEILLNVKKCYIDIYGEIPPMIAFLAIDTDMASGNKEITSQKGDKITLSKNELSCFTVRNALQIYQNHPQKYDWVPRENVNKLSSIVSNGAGQVRSNGRFIAYYNFDDIKNTVRSSINKINELPKQDCPYEVDFDDPKSGSEKPMIINVFGSIAGGTGSGMMVDILCYIRDVVDGMGKKTSICPWIMLPEIFRSMNSGPSMNNVLYNAYGALRTLDYMQHLDPGIDDPINLGNLKIVEPPFDYAYIINNYNKMGVSFNNLRDLAEIVAKSAFLPSNSMGDQITSPFDNIKAGKLAGNYDIKNKKAWAASAGSAELIYDNEFVAKTYASRILSIICASLINTTQTGVAEANKFVDSPEVLIRENNGQDNIIDALLQCQPESLISIDKDTEAGDLQSYYENVTNAKYLDEQFIRGNYDAKLANTKRKLDEEIASILDAGTPGCISLALKFLTSVQKIMNDCLKEMVSECEAFMIVEPDFEEMVSRFTKTGIPAIFGSKIDEEEAGIVMNELKRKAADQRDKIRHEWAIRFYNEFIDYLKSKQQVLNSFITVIDELSNNYRDNVLSSQNQVEASSKFHLYLHKEDVLKVDSYSFQEDVLYVQLADYFKKNGGLSTWLGGSKEFVNAQLTKFVSTLDDIKAKATMTIDEVLRNMDKETVLSYLNRLKVLASPLWNYNLRGYNDKRQEMDNFMVVGVDNGDTSILSSDPDYKSVFNAPNLEPSFASTHQKDRIYLMTVEDLLPIYAVNNFMLYQSDTEKKQAQSFEMANYIDVKLYNRMKAEDFKVLPTIEQDDVLETWVNGFIFGYIHFDSVNNTYWIYSKQQGDALDKDYRCDLNKDRVNSFEMFKSKDLYKELSVELQNLFEKEGKDKIVAKLKEIQDENSYKESYSCLSKTENDFLFDSKFKGVQELLRREVTLIRDLKF